MSPEQHEKVDGSTGPPENTRWVVPLSAVSSGNTSDKRVFVERFRMSPSVPLGPYSTMSTTALRKFGSSSDGLATKQQAFLDRQLRKFHARQSWYRMQDGQECSDQEDSP